MIHLTVRMCVIFNIFRHLFWRTFGKSDILSKNRRIVQSTLVWSRSVSIHFSLLRWGTDSSSRSFLCRKLNGKIDEQDLMMWHHSKDNAFHISQMNGPKITDNAVYISQTTHHTCERWMGPKITDTVLPVLRGHPFCRKLVASQNRWPLKRGMSQIDRHDMTLHSCKN